jgi:hypothetical protein
LREELGIDPQELGGSAWEAAITSFILFSLGAIVPVLPFLFARRRGSVDERAAQRDGTVRRRRITLFTGRSVLFSPRGRRSDSWPRL